MIHCITVILKESFVSPVCVVCYILCMFVRDMKEYCITLHAVLYMYYVHL